MTYTQFLFFYCLKRRDSQMANLEDEFKSLIRFENYSRSNGVFNLSRFVSQWILSIFVYPLYMGKLHCCRETPGFQTLGARVSVSSCLHRILVIFVTEKYTSSSKTIRELDDHCQVFAHSYLRYSEHVAFWQRRRAHKHVWGTCSGRALSWSTTGQAALWHSTFQPQLVVHQWQVQSHGAH